MNYERVNYERNQERSKVNEKKAKPFHTQKFMNMESNF